MEADRTSSLKVINRKEYAIIAIMKKLLRTLLPDLHLLRLGLPSLAAALLLAACATPGPRPVPTLLLQEDPFNAEYKVECDEVSGKTICSMTGNALKPFVPRYPLLALGIISEETRDNRTRFFLRILYVNEKEWLNLDEGESLQLILDGVSIVLDGPGSLSDRYVGEDGKVYEVALYETSDENIRKVAAAEKVAVQLGGDFELKKYFSPINKLYFHQFIMKYLNAPRGAQPMDSP
jgi:hypothetical protein